MNTRNPQYVGVTGFTARDEVRSVLHGLPPQFSRQVMVGLLVSSKTVRGRENRYPRRYPLGADVAQVFVDHPAALNLVHFNTKETDPFVVGQDALVATLRAGEACHGIQLNMAWPHPPLVERWREARGRYGLRDVVVLQCGGAALREAGCDPETGVVSGSRLANLARQYAGLVDYLLVDPSGGVGRPFEADFALGCLDALYSAELGPVGLGIAGGLSGDTLSILEPVAEKFPDVSIDAEGKLRDDADFLSTRLAREFVVGADSLFRRAERAALLASS